jgi:glycosyltransferase involved in cell wall biosynthesis
LKLIFFQYGDFGQAYRRFQEGGPETYRDQRASVDFVASLKDKYAVTTVAICEREHKEDLHTNLRSIGITTSSAYGHGFIDQLFDELRPDLIVCRTPHYHVIRWAKRNRVSTLLSFADFFSNRSPKQFLKNMVLRAQFDTRVFPCVANHSLNASISVSNALFYPKSRIVPWDWSRICVEPNAKSAPKDPGRPTAFFAGALTEAKGAGDCLQAILFLRKRGINLSLVFAGPGDVEMWRTRAAELGIDSQVRFLGLISNAEVRQKMVESDIVVVPSRHSYAEGLPNTIYEGLASRTPIVVSDHPAFANRLRNGENCLIFRGGHSASLADGIATLLTAPGLFARLSERSAAAHESLYVGMTWTDLVTTFLKDANNRTGWVEANCLTRLERNRAEP